jgi:hypothetical protein
VAADEEGGEVGHEHGEGGPPATSAEGPPEVWLAPFLFLLEKLKKVKIE